MKGKFKYTIISLVLLLTTISLFYKFYELKNIVFDGDGIGIYYFPFVRNERVSNGEVASYAKRFLRAAIVSLLATITSVYLLLKQKSA